jgi:hypothetical protein
MHTFLSILQLGLALTVIILAARALFKTRGGSQTPREVVAVALGDLHAAAQCLEASATALDDVGEGLAASSKALIQQAEAALAWGPRVGAAMTPFPRPLSHVQAPTPLGKSYGPAHTVLIEELKRMVDQYAQLRVAEEAEKYLAARWPELAKGTRQPAYPPVQMRRHAQRAGGLLQ